MEMDLERESVCVDETNIQINNEEEDSNLLFYDVSEQEPVFQKVSQPEVESEVIYEDLSICQPQQLDVSLHGDVVTETLLTEALDDAYTSKISSFLNARKLSDEFQGQERKGRSASREVGRGRRAQSASRLLQPTESFSVKCELRKAQEQKSLVQTQLEKRSQSVEPRRRPTTPQSPKFHALARSSRELGSPRLSSEELALQAIQKQKRVQEAIMKKHQQMFQKLKSKESGNPAMTTIRSTKELTIPMTPLSHVDKRLGKKEVSIIEEKKEFVKTKQPLGLTQPKPFQFKTDLRASLGSRPKPPSREELEEAEFQAAQVLAFKAKPVDKRVFESMGELGVPKVRPKEPTQPQEFSLASNLRAAYRASISHSNSRDDKPNFKARPMPSFEDDPRSKIKRGETKTTEAHSPKLHGDTRASSAPARRQRPNHHLIEKMKEDTLKKEKEQLKQPLKLTEPEEFDLQTTRRGLSAAAMLAAKLKREEEDEKMKAEIHALPFPEKIFKAPFVPAPSTKQLTEIEEFQLKTEERALSVMSKKTQELEPNGDVENTFHALPLPKSTFEPTFTIVPSSREPLMPKDINLQTSVRAFQRKSFDETVASHVEEILKKKEDEENERQKENQKMLKKLRSKSIEEGGFAFKASPVLQVDPYPVRHVEPPKLTEPVSPNLRTSLRVRPERV